MSRYYISPVRYSTENPIADALSDAGASIADGLARRRTRKAQAENDAIAEAARAERDRVGMIERGWATGNAPTQPVMREIERLPQIQGPAFPEAPEDPLGAAIRSYQQPMPQLQNPFGNPAIISQQQHPDYIETAVGGAKYHKKTPAAEQREKDREKDRQRQHTLSIKAREAGVPVPDWNTTDADEFEGVLADAVRGRDLDRRGASVGVTRQPNQDNNTFEAAVVAGESRNAQSIQANRTADDARIRQNDERDARVGRLADVLVQRGVTDAQQAAQIVSRALTSKDRRMGITATDVLRKAGLSMGGGRDSTPDPKVEARRIWDKISMIDVPGSSTPDRRAYREEIIRAWEKTRPELLALHGQDFADQVDALIRQLASTREPKPVTNQNRR